MKKFFRFLMAAAVLTSAAASCSDDGEEPVRPPMESVDAEANSSEGVSLYVSDISDSDFVIRTAMGEDVDSYYFDVAPMAKVFNDWVDYNAQQEAAGSKPVDNFEDYVMIRLESKAGSGGYNFKQEIDLQWGESIYKQHQLIHTADYFIMCLGLTEGNVRGELTTLQVPLHQRDLVGDPRADIELISDYRMVQYTFTKNADAAAYYQLATDTKQVKAIDEWYAANKEKYNLPDTFYRDLICCFVQSPHTDNFTDSVDWGDAGNPDVSVTVMTVGLDENLTPNTEMNRKTVNLTPKPDMDKAKINKIEITRCSATLVEFEYDVDWTVTRAIYFNLVDEAGKALAMSQYTGQNPNITWKQVLYLGGYGQNELNAKNEPRYHFYGMQPDHEYTLYICARNKVDDQDVIYNDEIYEDDRIIEIPVKTLPLVTDRPEDSKAELKVKLVDEQRQSFKIEYEWNAATVSISEFVLWTKDDPQSSGYVADPYDYPAIKQRLIKEGQAYGVTHKDAERSTGFTGYDPGNTYHHYIIAEDENGVLGEMIHTEANTKAIKGGPNPEATISGIIRTLRDGVTKEWYVTFESNEDATQMVYMVGDQTYSGEGLTEEEKIDKWTETLLGEQGMTTSSMKTYINVTVTRYSELVALCIPYGLTEKNERCMGKLAYLLFDPATLQSNVVGTARAFQAPAK